MTEANIHYHIPPSEEYPEDAEKIIAAIGAYQNELPFPADHHHEAGIEGADNGTVRLKLVRTVHTAETHEQLQQLSKNMRQSVESYFDPADHSRLSSYFVDDPKPKA